MPEPIIRRTTILAVEKVKVILEVRRRKMSYKTTGRIERETGHKTGR